MSKYNNLSAGSYFVYKAYEVKDSYDVYQQVRDTPGATDAMLTLATKLAEMAAIGVPVWYADKIFTKTGLDRVFEAAKRDQKLDDFYKSQEADSRFREIGIAVSGEIIIDLLQEEFSNSRVADPIFEQIYRWFDEARDMPLRVPRDPIVIDLDGDGLETVGINGDVYFDFDGNGILNCTGWVSRDDAILVLDRNGNGSIDSGRELFGEFTPLPDGNVASNGFAALKSLDSNLDGVMYPSYLPRQAATGKPCPGFPN